MFFSPIWTIFEVIRDINKTNVLTKFHYDWAKIVASRMFSRKTAPPTGVFTSFELNLDIIGTNLTTIFHEDRTRDVASRNDGQRPILKAHLSNEKPAETDDAPQ
ncbi:hypothetical protein DPMN_184086, partial [Dreissena polymorpha]